MAGERLYVLDESYQKDAARLLGMRPHLLCSFDLAALDAQRNPSDHTFVFAPCEAISSLPSVVQDYLLAPSSSTYDALLAAGLEALRVRLERERALWDHVKDGAFTEVACSVEYRHSGVSYHVILQDCRGEQWLVRRCRTVYAGRHRSRFVDSGAVLGYLGEKYRVYSQDDIQMAAALREDDRYVVIEPRREHVA